MISNNKVKTIFLFIAVMFFCDYTIGKTLKKYYFKQKKGTTYHVTYSIDKAKADIMVFGTSRAQHHYIPDVIDSIVGMSCYNVGQGGMNIFYSLAVQKAVLKRYKPKIMILEVYPVDLLHKSVTEYQILSFLLPYIDEHKEIWTIVKMRSKFEKYKMLSNIYPYNSLILPIIYNNISNKKNPYFKGFRPLRKKKCEIIMKKMNYKNITIDSNKIWALEMFIKNAQENNCELYVFVAPFFLNPDDAYLKTLKVTKEILNKYNVEFKDYSSDSLFMSNPDLFVDSIHMSEKGARIYSEIISKHIKKLRENIVLN